MFARKCILTVLTVFLFIHRVRSVDEIALSTTVTGWKFPLMALTTILYLSVGERSLHWLHLLLSLARTQAITRATTAKYSSTAVVLLWTSEYQSPRDNSWTLPHYNPFTPNLLYHHLGIGVSAPHHDAGAGDPGDRAPGGVFRVDVRGLLRGRRHGDDEVPRGHVYARRRTHTHFLRRFLRRVREREREICLLGFFCSAPETVGDASPQAVEFLRRP